MIKIINETKNYELEFEGLKIINCDNTRKLYKAWFYNCNIQINDKKYKQDDIIYISELTKISEFINFTKKSFLTELLNEYIGNENIINSNIVNDIINKINQKVDFDLLTQNDGEKSKLIQLIFEILDDKFIDEKSLKIIIEHLKNSKVFILDDISWIKLDFLYKYLNEHNFIILTNDFRKLLINKNQIELVVNVKNNNNFTEFLDSEILFKHLEHDIAYEIDNQRFNEFINEPNSVFSLQLFSKIKKI